MPSLKLKPVASIRAAHGHPWVYQTDVQKLLSPEHDGSVVECRDAKGFLLGSGLYNSRSRIVWRRVSRQKRVLEKEDLSSLIAASIARRKNENSRRLVWSDADFLPGLIVEQYDSILVVQTLTLGMEQRLELILEILSGFLSPSCVVVKNDAPIRESEGLPEKVWVARGELPLGKFVSINGVGFKMDFLGGQKTGYYLDQREQHLKVAALAGGKKVLDACCNQGGFALHCKKGGAAEVLGLDISEDAVRIARENAESSRLDVRFQSINIFDYFHQKNLPIWDMIILDPPPFAKSRAKLDEARRGYKELNLRAMKLLSHGGILATYCCSHHVTREFFYALISEAAWDAGREVRVLESCGQPLDHPIMVGFPESEYLHGYILQVI